NSVRAISPSSGGTTDAEGGGILLGGFPTPGTNTSANNLTDVTVAGNKVSGAGGTLTAKAGGIDADSNTTIQETLVGPNTAPTAPDCATGIVSNGFNVIRNTNGCGFLSGTGDKLNKN